MIHSHKTRIWDLPTRIFHWLLAFCVIAAYVCVKVGGLWMDWHVRFGKIIFGLILFRLIWGLIGPRYARFTQFVRGPGAVKQYLSGRWPAQPGHNPLGALSVIAMLLILGIQATTGLFADDDVFTTGPLAYISSDLSARMTGIHKFNEWFILLVVGLHIATILWYRFGRKEDLITAMITGNSSTPAHISSDPAKNQNARDDWRVRLGALLIVALIIALIRWINQLAPAAPALF